MGVPSRVYVGILVFGVMACVLVGGYTALILQGYEPPPEAPYEVFFPEEEAPTPAFNAFLVAASACLLLLTVWAWRSLVGAARRDQAIRRLKAEGKWPPPPAPAPAPAPTSTPQPERAVRRDDGPPPGYQ